MTQHAALGSGKPVSLEEVLANRDARAARQREALRAFRRPVLSLSLVIPGPVKDGPLPRELMEAALAALDRLLAQRAWTALGREVRLEATGPEALLSIDADALELKRAVADLEDAHPLGRLWDMDVLDASGCAISRRAVGRGARACLLCGEDAHACARSRAHPMTELHAAIEERLRAYRHGR